MGWWRLALVSKDGVAPSRMVGVSASVSLPLHHKVQKFSSGTGAPGSSRKKGRKTIHNLFAPGPIRSQERVGQQHPGQFAPWNFRSPERNGPETCY